MSFEDWWSKYRFQYLNGPTKKHCEESWNARNEEVASLTAQLAAARKKLQPSPCCVDGHLNAEWVGDESGYCLACARDEKLRFDTEDQFATELEDEREKVAKLETELSQLRSEVKNDRP